MKDPRRIVLRPLVTEKATLSVPRAAASATDAAPLMRLMVEG